MTWTKNGVTAQGFSAPPTDEFIVPFHGPSPATDDNGLGNAFQEQALAASGVMGHYHTERGLTLVNVVLSGHMIPQYAPSAAFRQLEFLLGRIPSLNSTVPFPSTYF
jgi:carboxypeptidase D